MTEARSRRISRRKFLALAGATGAVLACAPTADPGATRTGGATPRSGGTLRYATPYSNIGPTLNMLPPNNASAAVLPLYHMYDPLYRDTKASGGLVDWLAEKTAITSDGLTWTIDLRSGVKFHDGSEFDAAAVKANIDARKSHPTFPLKGQLAVIKEVTVVEKLKLQFLLSRPTAALRSMLSAPLFGMQSPAVMAKYSEAEYFKHASGTGPFRLEGAPTDSLLVLSRNPDYWGNKPYLDKIELRTIPDSSAALAALEAGDVDVVNPVPPADLARLKRDGRIALHPTVTRTAFLWLNTRKPPFTDKRARQAVVYALNRESYRDVYGRDESKVATHIINPDAFGAFEFTPYAYDVAKAKELLAAAGVPPGTTIEFLLNPEAGPAVSSVSQLIKQDLEKVGLRANIVTTAGPQFIAAVSVAAADTKWNITWSSYGIPYNDTEAAIFRMFYSANLAPKGQNWVHYENPKLDELIERQQSISNVEERKKALAELQQILWEDVPMMGGIEEIPILGATKALRGQDQYLANYAAPLFDRAWLDR
jgi:peptide/nickel transport system substrate-binding protein